MRIERRLRGTGAFVLSNGNHLPSTTFRIEQSGSGRTFLYCERSFPLGLRAAFGHLAGFQGQTTAGQPVQTHGDLNEYIDTGKEFCLILRNVEVGRVGKDGHSHEFSLTNLIFPTGKPSPIAFTVPWGTNTIFVSLMPLRNYRARTERLTKTRGIVPTAALRFHEADLKGDPISEFISDLCHAISLVQGRKINWIYHATYGRRRIFQHAVFGETITKAYPSHPLCFNPTAHTAVRPALTAAKEAIPAIKHVRETFDPHNRLINSWLDARTETDYLEARTLKYVVVIEALNALTTQADKTIATTVFDPKAWKQLYQQVLVAMPAGALANSLSLENWQRLNNRSFRDTLAAVCTCHHVTLPPQDLKLFSRIRNHIVHRLNYDHTMTLPSRWKMPNNPQAEQHFFVAQFVDRIILQLFGLRAHLEPVSDALADCQQNAAEKQR